VNEQKPFMKYIQTKESCTGYGCISHNLATLFSVSSLAKTPPDLCMYIMQAFPILLHYDINLCKACLLVYSLQ